MASPVSQHESQGEKGSNNKKKKEQQWLSSENKRALAHFSLRAAVLGKQNARVAIKFSVSPDTVLKKQQSWALSESCSVVKAPRLSGPAHSTAVMDRWAQLFHCKGAFREFFSPPKLDNLSASWRLHFSCTKIIFVALECSEVWDPCLDGWPVFLSPCVRASTPLRLWEFLNLESTIAFTYLGLQLNRGHWFLPVIAVVKEIILSAPYEHSWPQ